MSELEDELEETARQRQLLEAVGSRIRALRVDLGYSQARLADKARLSLPYLGALERAQANPSAITLARLALALNVEVSALFPSLPQLGAIRTGVQPEEREQRQEQVETAVGSAVQETQSLLSSALVASMVNVEPRTIQKWIKAGLLTPHAYVQSDRGQKYAAFRPEDLPQIIEVRNRASVRSKRTEKGK